jgi:hypothetical protein
METIGILSTILSWIQLEYYSQYHHGDNWNSIHNIIMETIGILSTKLSSRQLEFCPQNHHRDNW